MSAEIARWFALSKLYVDYAAALDEGRYDDWTKLFAEDCRYRVVARENYDRGFPLSLIDLHGVGMLRDRVYAVESTLFHAPYYQRHVVSGVRILADDGDIVASEANFVVIRTKRDMPAEVFSAGRYIDRVQFVDGAPRFLDRACVYDTDLIPNSVIYPL